MGADGRRAGTKPGIIEGRVDKFTQTEVSPRARRDLTEAGERTRLRKKVPMTQRDQGT